MVIVIPAKLEDCLQIHLRKPSDNHPKRTKFKMTIPNIVLNELTKICIVRLKYKLKRFKENYWYISHKILHLIK